MSLIIRKSCEHCAKQFTPNKYHINRQKFCKDKKCIRDRNVTRSKTFRSKNKDYFKKQPGQRCRTAVYDDQRRTRRKLDRIANRAFEGQKQLFVANARTVVSLLEFFLFSFLGMTSASVGGLRQTSAFNLCNLLDNFYKDGVSLVNADANFKSKLEVINELVTQFTQSPTASEVAEVFQLAGSAVDSPRSPEKDQPGSGDVVSVSARGG